MELPFSHDEFLDVFGAYNAALWPAITGLWLVTAGLAFGWMHNGGPAKGRIVFALLALHWAWSGIAYHWYFFRRINPAAASFGALFVAQSALFIWVAVGARVHFTAGWSVRGILGGGFVCYGLVYPLMGIGFGLEYPRLPLFAVPCPTTLVTAGLLIASTGIPRWVSLIPALWAVIGSSAAFTLGIRADFALTVAAVLLALDMFAPSALGART